MAATPDDPHARVLAAIAAEGGPRLTLLRPLTGGESSAALLVAGPDGQRLVVKAWPGGEAEAAELASRLELASALRVAGWPVPAVRAGGRFGDRIMIAWDWIDAAPTETLTEAMVDRLVTLTAGPRPRVDDAGGTFGRWLIGSLREGCDGYCVHESLARHGRATAHLLERIEGVGARLEPADVQPAAAVPLHVDLHHRNVLWRGEELAAIVDWEGVRPGHGGFDLVTLAFGLEVAETAPAAVERAWDAAISAAPAKSLQAFAAHMALRQVDWSIRHREAADVGFWLDVATRALDRVGAWRPGGGPGR